MGKYKKTSLNIWANIQKLSDGYYVDEDYNTKCVIYTGVMFKMYRSIGDSAYFDLYSSETYWEGELTKQEAKRLIKQRTSPLGKVLLGETDA